VPGVRSVGGCVVAAVREGALTEELSFARGAAFEDRKTESNPYFGRLFWSTGRTNPEVNVVYCTR